jgi:hypothetical protein
MPTKRPDAVEPGQDLLRRPCSIPDERIRLRGTPGQLVGVATVRRARHPEESAFKTLTNDVTETKFGYLHRLHYAPLLASSLPFGMGAPHGLSFGSLPAPDSEARVPVHFAVEALTPPGLYEATFDVAGQEQIAEIEVLPIERLTIAPRSIEVAGVAGETVSEEVVISNAGNVTLTLDIIGMLVLQEEEQVCLSLQRALGKVKSTPEGEPYKIFLDTLAVSLGERKTDFGRVRVAEGPIDLAPGESQLVRIAIQFPRDMIAGRRYRALLKARTAQLFVKITALAANKSPHETATGAA